LSSINWARRGFFVQNSRFPTDPKPRILNVRSSIQQRTFVEAAKWAFPFKKTEDLAYEPGPPARLPYAPEI
jgi:hypothetical protein